MRKTRWQIQNELKLDKLQTKLTAKGCEPNTLKTATIPFLQQKFYICPFCLNRNEPKNFIIMLPKGKIRKGLGKCPFCSNQVQWQTLMKIKEMTMQEFINKCAELKTEMKTIYSDDKEYYQILTDFELKHCNKAKKSDWDNIIKALQDTIQESKRELQETNNNE